MSTHGVSSKHIQAIVDAIEDADQSRVLLTGQALAEHDHYIGKAREGLELIKRLLKNIDKADRGLPPIKPMGVPQ